jgi:hypothetical protein
MAQQINLFNSAFLKKRQHFSAVTLLQALGLLVAGILAFYGYAIYETRELARVSAETDRQLKAQTAQVLKLTQELSPQGRLRLLEDEVARAAARLKQREEMLATVRTGGLGNTEGFARYLLAFARQHVNGVWLTGFSVGGDETELLLSGRVLHAELVPAYIRALSREDVMRGRSVSELRMTAREQREAPATAAPGANPAAPAAPAAPTRYVEFNLTALRGAK